MQLRLIANRSGFTAVELLVTVVLAAIFINIIAQLYLGASAASAETRKDSVANDIAKNVLEDSLSNLSNCSSTINSPPNQTAPFIGSYSYTITTSCPYSGNVQMARAVVTVTYSNGSKKVSQASYFIGGV